MEKKICPICGKEFIPHPQIGREQLTCSRSCGAILRFRKHPPYNKGKRRPPLIKTCEWCGQAFQASKKTRRFCSLSCASKAHATPDQIAKAVAAQDRPSVRQHRSERLRRSNPMSNPDARRKMIAKLTGRAFSGQRGGNGQITTQQRTLADALGWPTEISIKTGKREWSHATVDIANQGLKIAIEVDGASHLSKKQQNRDAKKQLMLESLGWCVMRFWNSEIENNLPQVVARIQAQCNLRSSRLSP